MSSPCPSNRMGGNSPGCTPSRSASVFYFVTTVCAMLLLTSIIILFFFCLFIKRRRLQAHMRNYDQSALPPLGPAPQREMTAYESANGYPAPNIPPSNGVGTNVDTNGIPKNAQDSGPFHCVIMAGEDQPTFIALPLPPTKGSSGSNGHISRVFDEDASHGTKYTNNDNR